MLWLASYKSIEEHFDNAQHNQADAKYLLKNIFGFFCVQIQATETHSDKLKWNRKEWHTFEQHDKNYVFVLEC